MFYSIWGLNINRPDVIQVCFSASWPFLTYQLLLKVCCLRVLMPKFVRYHVSVWHCLAFISLLEHQDRDMERSGHLKAAHIVYVFSGHQMKNGSAVYILTGRHRQPWTSAFNSESCFQTGWIILFLYIVSFSHMYIYSLKHRFATVFSCFTKGNPMANNCQSALIVDYLTHLKAA